MGTADGATSVPLPGDPYGATDIAQAAGLDQYAQGYDPDTGSLQYAAGQITGEVLRDVATGGGVAAKGLVASTKYVVTSLTDPSDVLKHVPSDELIKLADKVRPVQQIYGPPPKVLGP